jgi:Ca-activated chloride channel family protein
MVAYARRSVYAVLCISGLGCLVFAAYQQRYSETVARGNQAVHEQRFDTRAYERASSFWLAQQDTLLFNQGVLAFKAQNLPRAADYFRQASQRTNNTRLRTQALYNLGMVMLALEEVEGAAEMFKEALRLDPQDNDTKFNLERLYHFVLRQEGEHGEASLKQAPGAQQQGEEQGDSDGQGRSSPQSGI